MPRERTSAQPDPQTDRANLACFRCKTDLDLTGWCDGCAMWPKTITPRRLGICGHRVDVDGFCWTCHQYLAPGLELGRHGWLNTNRMGQLLPKEESRARVASVDKWLISMLLKAQPTRRDIEAEKRALAGIAKQVEEVPF